jgi:glutathione S-transferase
MGAPGSPYTRKMLAVLRYRRIPYRFVLGRHGSFPNMPQPKVALLPTFYLPKTDGSLEAVVDSTPLIRRFEREFEARKVVPTDPAIAFLDYLLEDFADEWLTKAMFHYRWHYAADAELAGEILPRWSSTLVLEGGHARMKQFIKERQIARLYVVGSNDTTAPVIEASYRRTLQALKDHLEQHLFLMGARPGASDFATYGQLTQLAKFDPTPMGIAISEAPRVFAWVDFVEDLSGLEPREEDWLARDAIPESLRALFAEAGRVYVPVMLANLAALKRGDAKVETNVDGQPWVQEPFPYQAKCVQWVREAYDALDEQAQKIVRGALEGTGCMALLTARA